MKISKILLMAAPIALAGIGTAAQAESRSQIVVNHGDLNLSSTNGQAELKARVRTAIRNVCLHHSWGGLNERVKAQKCMNKARHDADEQLARLFSRNGSQIATQDVRVEAAR